MIEAVNVTKSFGDIVAVDDVTLSIESGKVFGLIGTNGAGKSTFLRMIAGVLKPDSGRIEIDGRPVFENPACKEDFFYISDEAYFFLNATADEMERFYEMCYPTYSRERYEDLMGRFELDRRRKISTFSKGMKKQLSVILGLASNTRYMLCDETFDGLDPVMRQGVKSLFAQDMADREFTPVIASHNLRELEDICDTVGLLYKGGMLLSEDLDDIKVDIHKVQVVFPTDYDPSELLGRLRILEQEKRGSLYTIIARGKQDELNGTLMEGSPLFIEALPLSLEEIFITSTGVEGYDIKKIIY